MVKDKALFGIQAVNVGVKVLVNTVIKMNGKLTIMKSLPYIENLRMK